MNLKRAFKEAILGGVTLVSLAGVMGCTDSGSDSEPPSDSVVTALTKGEVEFERSVFGDGIDTSGVRKYLSGKRVPGVAAEVLNEKQIVFYADYHSPDYSQGVGLCDYGIFIHEMTHVWQAQNDVSDDTSDTRHYRYSLDTNHCFTDYGSEQQAAIIEDYARYFLYPLHGERRWNQENPDLLVKVVEDQFPQARKTRLALENKKAARTVKLASAGLTIR